MFARARTAFAAALLVLAAPAASHAALAPYIENFETLDAADPTALGSAGWLVYGNVYSATYVYQYGYGPYPAPNDGAAFCAIATGEGGPEQGAQQLSVYNDYNNTAAHTAGDLVESNVYREMTIGAGDVGSTWTFQFDAKLGNLVSPSTAIAFIKTLNPAAGYATTNFRYDVMTGIPDTWHTYRITLTIDPSLVDQLLQIGFASTASNFVSSGVFYDNLVFLPSAATDVAGGSPAAVLDLRPNAPNPFRSSTRLDFSLAHRGPADVAVYDVAGRRVATLFHGEAEAGPHSVVWDGRLADGRVAPAGVYRAVLGTAAGRVTRSMVLAR